MNIKDPWLHEIVNWGYMGLQSHQVRQPGSALFFAWRSHPLWGGTTCPAHMLGSRIWFWSMRPMEPSHMVRGRK